MITVQCRQTGYVTETESFGWSFVLEASLQHYKLNEIIAQTDDPEGGMGRVK